MCCVSQECIGYFVHVTNLCLSNNRLTDLPAAVGRLTGLRELYLSNNRLVHLPTTIGSLTQLVRA